MTPTAQVAWHKITCYNDKNREKKRAPAKFPTGKSHLTRSPQMANAMVIIEEYYHNKPHDGIRQYYVSQGWDYPEEGISPLCEWRNDSRRFRYLNTDEVAQTFLHHTQRLVDKGGYISLFGRQYEVSTALIGAKVKVSYDPMLLDTVTVRYQGIEPITAHPLVIKEEKDSMHS